MIDILFLIGGLVLLGLGGEGIVHGSVMIAERLKLSTLLISTVVVGFGTSMPEMMVSVQAALSGSPDISLGNVVGSNICNTVLVLGIAAVIFPIACNSSHIRRDVFVGVVAALFLTGLSFTGVINRFAGIAMVSILIAYLSYCIWSEKRKAKLSEQEFHEVEHKLLVAVPIALVSIVCLVGGAKLLVLGATSLAHTFGISEAIIGLTVVAFGTSLPELATAFSAARKKHSDVVIGNILGSNLFNIFAILGVTSIVKPIKFIGQIATQDVWIMLATATLLIPMVLTRGKIGRGEGALLLAIYVGYISWLGYIS